MILRNFKGETLGGFCVAQAGLPHVLRRQPDPAVRLLIG